ncbi:ecdysteroid-phosphate phosphatase-like [Culicoides brevitarsis]|uniref:ecdysteroid-phosphate phosphatase-like n=1 Tax=Culicoides brevitarsis TaxID=469753 RepID=UPI00307C5C5F
MSDRKIFLLRHAERVDFIMPQWYNTCFDGDGKYLRRDLNMPKSVPARKEGPRGWIKDTPLTNVGLLQAALIGESMREKEVKIDAVYVSPAFRCVQTADAALRELGLRDVLPLRIDPGLYEWTGFVETHFPQLYTPQELAALGYNIDLSYVPHMSVPQLRDCLKETVPDLYKRNHRAMLYVLEHSRSTGNILVVVHAISLETCTRNLLGKNERPWPELKTFFGKVGLCSMVALRENTNDGKKYEFVEPPGGPITQSNNEPFDWRIFLDA